MSIGLYAARSTSEGSKKYFFADQNLTWFIVGLSLFATSITGNQILGIIGMATLEFLVPGQFGAIAALSLLILGWLFAPDMLREKISTAPEYLEKKFNKSSRTFFAVFSVIFYFFVRLSITLFAAGIILSKLFSIDPFTASQIIVIITGFYVIIGGFSAVTYTQAVQSIFMILGVLAIVILGLYKVNDLGLIWNKLTISSHNIIQPLFYSRWAEILTFIGGLIIGSWFWCTDQFIIQRILSIKNKEHARRSTVLASFLYIILLVFILLISISAGIIYSDKGVYITFSKLILELNLHYGLTGLILSGALAMLMASLASLYSSVATIFTYDFTNKNINNISDRKLVLKGRLVTLTVVIFSIVWIPIIRMVSNGFIVLLIQLPVFCSPAIAAVFIFGRMHKEKLINSAIPVMIIGIFLGILYTILIHTDSVSVFNSIANVPFVYFIIVSFGLSYMALSLQSRKQAHTAPREFKSSLKLSHIGELFLDNNPKDNHIIINATLSVILVLLVISMWWVFKI